MTKERKRKYVISGTDDSSQSANKVARSIGETRLLDPRPSDKIISQALPSPGSSKEDEQPYVEAWNETLPEGQDHDFNDVFDDLGVNMDQQIFDEDVFENTTLSNPTSSWGHNLFSAPTGSPYSLKSRSMSRKYLQGIWYAWTCATDPV